MSDTDRSIVWLLFIALSIAMAITMNRLTDVSRYAQAIEAHLLDHARRIDELERTREPTVREESDD